MSRLSRRQILGGAGAGLLLAPFLNAGVRREALAAGTPVKRLLLSSARWARILPPGSRPSPGKPSRRGVT